MIGSCLSLFQSNSLSPDQQVNIHQTPPTTPYKVTAAPEIINPIYINQQQQVEGADNQGMPSSQPQVVGADNQGMPSSQPQVEGADNQGMPSSQQLPLRTSPLKVSHEPIQRRLSFGGLFSSQSQSQKQPSQAQQQSSIQGLQKYYGTTSSTSIVQFPSISPSSSVQSSTSMPIHSYTTTPNFSSSAPLLAQSSNTTLKASSSHSLFNANIKTVYSQGLGIATNATSPLLSSAASLSYSKRQRQVSTSTGLSTISPSRGVPTSCSTKEVAESQGGGCLGWCTKRGYETLISTPVEFIGHYIVLIG